MDVACAVKKLNASDRWDEHKLRTLQYVHSDVSDIWVRFCEWQDENSLEQFNKPHESVWYPIVDEIPELKEIVSEVVARAGDVDLGGVLITKIKPGGKVLPHKDAGWHAEHYNVKHGVQLAGNDQQVFGFEDSCLSPETGEVFRFDNSRIHWVLNNSEVERMTMIICMRVK